MSQSKVSELATWMTLYNRLETNQLKGIRESVCDLLLWYAIHDLCFFIAVSPFLFSSSLSLHGCFVFVFQVYMIFFFSFLYLRVFTFHLSIPLHLSFLLKLASHSTYFDQRLDEHRSIWWVVCQQCRHTKTSLWFGARKKSAVDLNRVRFYGYPWNFEALKI